MSLASREMQIETYWLHPTFVNRAIKKTNAKLGVVEHTWSSRAAQDSVSKNEKKKTRCRKTLFVHGNVNLYSHCQGEVLNKRKKKKKYPYTKCGTTIWPSYTISGHTCLQKTLHPARGVFTPVRVTPGVNGISLNVYQQRKCDTRNHISFNQNQKVVGKRMK